MAPYAKDAFPTNTKPDAEKLDALIIGAGVAGLCQLHLHRNQRLKARAYDSASDVGGTFKGCRSRRAAQSAGSGAGRRAHDAAPWRGAPLMVCGGVS